ncbi:MAG TPA: hypothetical protein VGQ00_02315 [Candidatus Norongarragalinales archaeon]|jgi:hypothetical protein|nr:hypothetical protein [Candidatus Norongarragalinales archaeon]
MPGANFLLLVLTAAILVVLLLQLDRGPVTITENSVNNTYASAVGFGIKNPSVISFLDWNSRPLDDVVDQQSMPDGVLRASFSVDNSTLRSIDFFGLDTQSRSNVVRVDEIDPSLFPKHDFLRVFAIDPTSASFEKAKVTVKAKGSTLYKCKDWDFGARSCRGTWELFRSDLVPGQEYSFFMTPNDPGFGEGAGTFTLVNITVDGVFSDWDPVLANPRNVITDGLSGVNDPDNVTIQSADRDLLLFAVTWNASHIFFYFKRAAVGQNQIPLLVYIDKNTDGFLNSTDPVARFLWFGSNAQFDSYNHTYIPANATGDALTGDGFAEPGTINAGTSRESNIVGSDTSGIILETRMLWTDLGLSSGQPLKFHVSSARGAGTNLPSSVEDNLQGTDTVITAVSIVPNNTGGGRNGTTVQFNHTVTNLGTSNDTVNIYLNSSQNFTLRANYSNGTALSDTNGDTVMDVGRLQPDANANITVYVTIPVNAASGTSDNVTVNATSSVNSSVSSAALDSLTVGDINIVPSRAGSIINNTVLSFNHTITNLQSFSDVINVNATSTQGWNLTLVFANGTALTDSNNDSTIDVGNLSASASINITLKIAVPAVAAGTTDTQTVRINSTIDQTVTNTVQDHITVAAKRVSIVANQSTSAGKGSSVFYEHTITNNWNQSDVIDISNRSTLGWTIEQFNQQKTTRLTDSDADTLQDTGAIAGGGGTFVFSVKVLVPSNASSNTTDTEIITINSSLSTSVSDTLNDTTTAVILATYSDSARTNATSQFIPNATVYAKAWGLTNSSNVFFQWIDYNGTILRTSPSQPVLADKTSTDELVLANNATPGNYSVIVFDSQKNKLLETTVFFVRDIVPPNITITSPQNVSFNTTNVTVTANTSENVTVCLTSVDGGSNQTMSGGNNSWTLNLSGIEDGPHNVRLYCNDSSNNIGTNVTYFSVNTSAPQIQFASPTSNGTLSQTWIFANVTASDGDLRNITIFLYNASGALVNSSTSSSSPLQVNFTGLASGTYYLNATARDSFNNTNATETRTIVLSQAPVVNITNPYTNTINQSSIVANATASPTASVCLRSLDSGSNVTMNGSGASWSTNLDGLADGSHSLVIYCNSTGGQIGNSSVFFTVDASFPQIRFVTPTSNGTLTQNWIFGNVTANDTTLQTITLNLFNSTGSRINFTTSNSSPLQFNFTGLASGNYSINATANDSVGRSNSTETRLITLNSTLPLIISTAISPYAAVNGSAVNLFISAQNYLSVFATVRMPNGTSVNVSLTNGSNTSFSNTVLLGTYNVTFRANDTLGNESTATDYFEAFQVINFVFRITNNTLVTGENSSWTAFYRAQAIASNASSIGSFSHSVANAPVDINLSAYNGRLRLSMRSVNMSQCNDTTIGMDKLSAPVSGQLRTYALNTSCTASLFTVRAFYDDANFSNESAVRFDKCSDWNFSGQSCNNNFSDISSISTQNATEHSFTHANATLSGFGIREPTPTPTPTPAPGGGGGGGGGAGGGGGGGATPYPTVGVTPTPTITATATPGPLTVFPRGIRLTGPETAFQGEFIEILVEDLQGNAIPFVPFEVKFPSGRLFRLISDDTGHLRFLAEESGIYMIRTLYFDASLTVRVYTSAAPGRPVSAPSIIQDIPVIGGFVDYWLYALSLAAVAIVAIMLFYAKRKRTMTLYFDKRPEKTDKIGLSLEMRQHFRVKVGDKVLLKLNGRTAQAIVESPPRELFLIETEPADIEAHYGSIGSDIVKQLGLRFNKRRDTQGHGFELYETKVPLQVE